MDPAAGRSGGDRGPARPRPQASTRQGLADQLGHIDGVLPGSVVIRHMRCGKAACACKAEPPTLHGPYTQWTRTVDGKTVTRFLTPEQLARYQPWFDNARHLKDLVAKLQLLSVRAVEEEDRRQPGTEPNRTQRHQPRRTRS